jgi:hypothetical protein
MNQTQHKEELNVVVSAWNYVLLHGILGMVKKSKCSFVVLHLKFTNLDINHGKFGVFFRHVRKITKSDY